MRIRRRMLALVLCLTLLFSLQTPAMAAGKGQSKKADKKVENVSGTVATPEEAVTPEAVTTPVETVAPEAVTAPVETVAPEEVAAPAVTAITPFALEEGLATMELEEGEEIPAPSIKIANTGVKIGKPIAVITENYPEGSTLTYKWTVAGKQVSTAATYTPSEADNQKWIQVTVSCTGYADQTAKVYCSNLPVMYLDFDLDYVIATKSIYVPGTMKLQGNADYSKDSYLYDGVLEVKGRGNTSWSQSKKPFKLKLDSKANILNMGKNKHWVLLADATEGSLMRNELAYKLSGLFGLTYQDGTWVDVVINGNYYGNYYLCEHIRIGTTRVDIADLMDDADAAADAIYAAGLIPDATKSELETYMEEHLGWISDDTMTYNGVTVQVSDYYTYDKDALITGGYLFELDGYYDEVSKFKSSLNQPIMFNSPEFVNTNTEMMNYVKNFINAFEAAIQNPNFRSTYNGKTVSAYDLFDFDALMKYWLVEEIFNNCDGMKKSTYFHKDRDTADGISKITMGPVWDMDWSSDGMAGSHYTEWQTIHYNDSAQANQWYKYICKDPYFMESARRYYWSHHAEIKDMINSIYGEVETSIFKDYAYEYLYLSAMSNESLWGRHKTGYVGEVTKFYTFLNNRINWMDGVMGSLDTMINSMGLYTPNTAVDLSVDGSDLSIYANGTRAEVIVNGELVASPSLTNNSATVDISSAQTDDADVVYVVVYNSSNTVIGTNYKYDQTPARGELIELNVQTPPRNTVYEVGTDLDLSGMVVNGIYAGGSANTILNAKLEVSGYDKNTTGTQTVTVSYAGKSDTFEVTVLSAEQKVGSWSNEYVTVYSDADTSGSKKMNLSVWKAGDRNLYTSSVGVNYSGDFTDLTFSFETAPGWKVQSVKYKDATGDRNNYIITLNATSGTFTFKGDPLSDATNGNTLIIDIVPYTEVEEPSYTTLVQSFTAKDCGQLTQALDQLGLDHEVGFQVTKDGKPAFTSTKKFTYEGEFKDLAFLYTAPEGYEVESVEAILANVTRSLTEGTRIPGRYEDGVITFDSYTGSSDMIDRIVINLVALDDGSPKMSLAIEKDTVKYNLNAVVYLTINADISASDIVLKENGAVKAFSYEPTVVDNGDGTYTWKLYIKPGTVAIHTYQITVGDLIQEIKIRGAKTIYS